MRIRHGLPADAARRRGPGWLEADPDNPAGRERSSRRILFIPLLILLLLTSCGGVSSAGQGDGPERVTLTLDWYPNADHAGVYAAEARAYFEEAGLDVEIRQPS